MKYWLCKIYVTKMTGTFCHITSACLTSRISVNDTLSWIHEAAQFRAATFHGFWKSYATICD